MKSDRKTR